MVRIVEIQLEDAVRVGADANLNNDFASDDRLEIDYTYNNPGTPPVYNDITLVLFFTQFLSSTAT